MKRIDELEEVLGMLLTPPMSTKENVRLYALAVLHEHPNRGELREEARRGMYAEKVLSPGRDGKKEP